MPSSTCLGVAFYRPSGALLSAVDSSYAVTPPSPANVKCGSSSPGIDRQHLLEEGEEVVDRRDGAGAQSRRSRQRRSGTRRANGRMTSTGAASKTRRTRRRPIRGKTSNAADANDGKSVVDWGSLEERPGLQPRRSPAPSRGTTTRAPRSSRTSGSTPRTSGRRPARRAASTSRSVAAHEIGHALQFDHVTNASKDDETTLMWPYFSDRRHERAASSAAATRSRTTATTRAAEGSRRALQPRAPRLLAQSHALRAAACWSRVSVSTRAGAALSAAKISRAWPIAADRRR